MAQLTAAARHAWKQAASEAAGSGSPEIEPVHLLLALLSLETAPPGTGAMLEQELVVKPFLDARVDRSELRLALRRSMPRAERVYEGATVHRSPASRAIFGRAETLSDGDPVSAPHLLAACLERPDRVLEKALSRISTSADRIRGWIRYPSHLTESSAGTRAAESQAGPLAPSRPISPDPAKPAPGTARGARARKDSDQEPEERVLERFGKDLTQLARDGKIAPIIGRRAEILQTIQALARKKKNNPVLVGDAGVGKTAVVEALALRAVEGKDPQVLAGRRIVELDMGSLLSGTSLRGQFEERMRRLIDEASADENLILFIDEIHTIMGAGGGAQDAAQLLKPALSRGAMKLIGATTIDEYRQYIEKDPAMDRRFEKILIDEPSRDEAVEMLMGLRASLASHHRAEYGDDAVAAAVDLSMRIDVDHRLPDKAIDLLDRAGARSSVTALSLDPFEHRSGTGTRAPIGALDVAHVLAEKMGMPVEIVAGHLDPAGARRLLGLEDFLRGTIKGQDRAVEALSERMILAHASVMERRGPLATLLFLGPSGVGKTEMAKQLALFLFGSDKNLVRFDMSEFKEEHSISKLIGSPPGYVGSDQDGQLTGQIRRKPYAIVLLDEVEKAHPRIYDVFLQVFDEGRITDSKGRLADARNCIFLLTTNVRPEADARDRAAIDEALKTWFRPELINRIDEIVPFDPLSPESVGLILDGHLAKLVRHLAERHGVELEVDPAARDLLAQAGYHPEYGARELRRTLERMVQVPLSRLVLSGDLARFAGWRLEAGGEGIRFVHA